LHVSEAQQLSVIFVIPQGQGEYGNEVR